MTKLEALRRSVARLFGRPATSVPPKSNAARLLDDMLDDLARRRAREPEYPPTPEELAQGFALRLAGKPLDLPSFLGVPHSGSVIEDLRRAIEPQDGPFNPRTGERMPRPEHLRWEHWDRMQRDLARPGWAFGRIGCHLHNEGCHQPFGLLRDQFGVFWQPFYRSDFGHNMMFACLIHLRSGGGIGVFEDLALACDAAEAAMALPVDWATINPHDGYSWSGIKPSVEAAWRFVGLHTAHDFHVHDPDGDDMGPPMHVFVRDCAQPKGMMS